MIRFTIFGVATDIAYMRMGQCHQLFGIGRVGEDLLVTGDGRIEDHFSHRGARAPTNTLAFENGSIC